MNTCIYDKTDKGREEIATRKHQVPARLRTLLVLIDGRRTVESLLHSLAALGVSAQQVEQLLGQQMIALVGGGHAADLAEPEAPGAPRPPASARARMLARTRDQAARKRLASEAGVSAD